MRMRPKKNRLPRLEAAKEMFAAFDEDGKLNASLTFSENSRKQLLELGCGKGSFALGLSKKNPDCNILAVEKVIDVILMAMEKAKKNQCENVKFASFDVENINEILPDGFADSIYINFCDPWPKSRNAKRRLTSPLFLERYKKLMKDGARIYFKTDNFPLFEYSLETFKDAGFVLENVCFDLHNDVILNENNIRTEYEENFSAKGFAINYLEAFLPDK